MLTRILVVSVLLALPCLPTLGADDDLPRTPSGKPDLSGTYDIKTRTPITRSANYGNDPYMTAEDAKEIEEATAETRRVWLADSDPNRGAPVRGGKGEFQNVGRSSKGFLDLGSTAFTVDGKYRNSILTEPADGRMPSLTAVGKKHLLPFAFHDYNGPPSPDSAWWLGEDVLGPDGQPLTYTFGEHRIFDHPELLGLSARCIYRGASTIPMLPSAYNNFKKIIQTETQVVILVEWMHWARVIRLASEGRSVEHEPSQVRSLSGDSIGWWEGDPAGGDDTLVVDTTNFLRSWDTPHEGLHVVERFTRQDDGTLFYEFRIDDPDYAAPYGGSLPMPRSDDLIYEVACHEGNYSMRGTLLGARMLEEQWYKKHGRGARGRP